MKHEDLFPLVKSLTETRSAVVLQALGDHLPMHPAAAISLLAPFFGGVDMAIRLIASGLENECFTMWRDGVQVDGVPEDPSNTDELRMGPAFVPTLHAFGAGVRVEQTPPDLDKLADMVGQMTDVVSKMCEQPTKRF